MAPSIALGWRRSRAVLPTISVVRIVLSRLPGRDADNSGSVMDGCSATRRRLAHPSRSDLGAGIYLPQGHLPREYGFEFINGTPAPYITHMAHGLENPENTVVREPRTSTSDCFGPQSRYRPSALVGRRFGGDQRRQLPHVVECRAGAGGPQGLGISGPAMAAAMEAEHCHSGGNRAGNAGKAVLDHKTSPRRRLHLRGGKQKQVRRGLAVGYL